MKELIESIAKALVDNPDQVQVRSVEGEQVTARIKADKERATSLGVDRTPVLFVNDHQLPVTAFNPAGLHEAIDAASKAGILTAKPKG